MEKVLWKLRDEETGKVSYFAAQETCQNKDVRADLQKVIENMDACAHRLFFLSNGCKVEYSLRCKMEAYANVVKDVATALYGEIM